VLAGEGKKLVALGALGNLDTVLVGPLLDLAVRPGVEKSIGEVLLGGSSRRGGLVVGTLSVQAGKTRVTAEAGNERVAGVGLGNLVTALVEPGLEVRVGPRSVEPVTRVVVGLLGLLCGGLVVLTDSLQEGVTLAGLGDRNAVLVGEGLELRVGPTRAC
jgi:hypothetical protein